MIVLLLGLVQLSCARPPDSAVAETPVAADGCGIGVTDTASDSAPLPDAFTARTLNW